MNGAVDERLVEAFVDRAQRGLGIIDDEQLDAGWERLQHTSAPKARPGRVRPSRRLHLWVAGLATAGVAAVLAVLVYRTSPANQGSPLRYSVEGAVVAHGRSLTGATGEGSRLLFSDDSRIALGALTQLSVDALDVTGAQVTLVDGSIDVYVKPRSHTSWRFAAGPFQVKVKGTTFRLGYAAQARRMSLYMTSGLVEVVGSQGRTIAVGAGESIELFAEPALTAADIDSGSEQPTAVEKNLAPAPVALERVAANNSHGLAAESAHRRSGMHAREESGSVAEPATVSWSKLLTQGRFAEVVADAERRGIETTLAQASAADLSSLADAARYTKRHDLARQVLLAMRARFAGTEPARDASFFLGRLGESVPGQPDAALGWYDTYLRESPRGLYASEALGREMTLLAPKARERASKLAKQYLERFPHGSQIDLARSLLETGND
jgi:hypothetical protein